MATDMTQRGSWEKAGYDWFAHDAREKSFLDELSATTDFDAKVSLSRDYFAREHAVALSSGISEEDPYLHSPDFLLRMQVESF